MKLVRCKARTPAGGKPTFPVRTFLLLGILGLSLVSVLTACAPGSDLPLLPDPTDAAKGYQLGSGDQIRVINFGEDRLTGEFTVDDTGSIALPLVGIVRASGMTSAQLGAAIEADLRAKELLSRPSVAVEVVRYRPIFILGEVTKPGEYPYRPGMTLLSAVSVAGGFTYRGIKDYASIVRLTGSTVVEGKVTRQALIRPGDVITIFERRW